MKLGHEVIHFSEYSNDVEEQTWQMVSERQYRQDDGQFLHEFTSTKVEMGQVFKQVPFIK